MPIVSCPYYPRHVFPDSTWAYHVPKCRLRYETEQIGQPMRVCPFSARHVIPDKNFQQHLKTCDVRATYLAEEAVQIRAAGQAGNIKVWDCRYLGQFMPLVI